MTPTAVHAREAADAAARAQLIRLLRSGDPALLAALHAAVEAARADAVRVGEGRR